MKVNNLTVITYDSVDSVRREIKNCEGKHQQQVAYSTYHDAMTQICFDCRYVRTNLDLSKKGTHETKSI